MRELVSSHVKWFLSETENLLDGKPSIQWWEQYVGNPAYTQNQSVNIAQDLYILAKEVLDEDTI